MVKESNSDYISHKNIKESHINEYGLHIYRTGSSILAKNLISGTRNFWCFLDSKKEVNIDGSCLNNIRFYDSLRPESETIFMNSVPEEHQDDIILGLENLRIKYLNKIIMGHLNINSIRNKFELLSSLKIDIFLINETKLDPTFPANQFFIQGYSIVYRLDRNDKGRGIMLFVKDDFVTFSLDRYSFPVAFEAFCIELNLWKKKRLIFCIYNPHNRFISKNWEKPLNFTQKRTKTLELWVTLTQRFLSLIWHLSVLSKFNK